MGTGHLVARVEQHLERADVLGCLVHGCYPAGGLAAGISRTATVIRVRTHSRPSSSLISTSQIHVVRPRCLRTASAKIVPWVIGRTKLVWFERPIACLPSRITASPVPTAAKLSAID